MQLLEEQTIVNQPILSLRENIFQIKSETSSMQIISSHRTIH